MRVIQWTTGNVGYRSLRAVLRHPAHELVGVFAHSPDKVGRDAAELAGLSEPTGVTATADEAALLALRPDVCVYTPLWPDVDVLCRLLAAGVNVVSTAGFITGRAFGPGAVARLEAAARSGRATLFGTGVNPGFANLLALVGTQLCDRVDQIRVIESVDSTGYDSGETEASVGYGTPVESPDLPARTEAATAVFGDAVALMGDALGIDFDRVSFDVDYAAASARRDLGYLVLEPGTVTGIDGRWRGWVGERDVVVLNFQWIKGEVADAPFTIRDGYYVEIDGEPSVRLQLRVRPPRDWREPDFMGIGMIMTAMPAVNAIDAVVAAPPGIATHATLPLVAARGFAGG